MKYLLIISLLYSCATPFRPYKEVGWTCKDVVKHKGCKKSKSRYDNIDLHDHDPRELQGLDPDHY